jgi:hypothetical protein
MTLESITFRPMTAADVGRVPIGHQGEPDERFITRGGGSGNALIERVRLNGAQETDTRRSAPVRPRRSASR